MKRLLVFAAVISTLCLNYNLSAQELQKPSEGKALIYFMRTSTAAPIVKFSFFHGDKYLGKFNGGKYMVYEVDPGEHLFWARSENTAFLEANVQAGGVYIVDTTVKMGAFKAAVGIRPLDKNAKNYERYLKRVKKLFAKNKERNFTEEERKTESVKMADMISRIMEKYERQKAEGKEMAQLTPDMYHVLHN